MSSGINKFYEINTATKMIDLLDELSATSYCCGVKFTKTGEKCGPTYTLKEIFKHVETETAKNQQFMITELVFSLQHAVKKELQADKIDAPKWSFKWLVGLLFQLGRAIARFLCQGCKKVNYDSQLKKWDMIAALNDDDDIVSLPTSTLAIPPSMDGTNRTPTLDPLEEIDADLPPLVFGPITSVTHNMSSYAHLQSNSPQASVYSPETSVLGPLFPPASRTIEMDPDDLDLPVNVTLPSPPAAPTSAVIAPKPVDLAVQAETQRCLTKAERGEKLTKAEYNHLLNTLTSLDLTKWRNPQKINVEKDTLSYTSEHDYEWMPEFLSSCKLLQSVKLPEDPILFKWLILDPVDRRKDDTRQFAAFGRFEGDKESFSIDNHGGRRGRSTLFYNCHDCDIKFEFKMPLLNFEWSAFRGTEQVSDEEFDRFYKYVDTPEKHDELLAINFPKAKERAIANNLQMALNKRLDFIKALVANIHTLFDEKLVLSEHWATFFGKLAKEEHAPLYKALMKSPEKLKFFLPVVEAIRKAPPTASHGLRYYQENPHVFYRDYPKEALKEALKLHIDNVPFVSALLTILVTITNDRDNLFEHFSSDAQFEGVVTAFANSATTPEERNSKLEMLLSQNFPSNHYITIICKVMGKTPLDLITNNVADQQQPWRQDKIRENLAAVAVMDLLADPAYPTKEARQAAFLELFNKVRENQKANVVRVIVCGGPIGTIKPLLSILAEICIAESHKENKDKTERLVIYLFDSLSMMRSITSYPGQAQKFKEAFDTLWGVYGAFSYNVQFHIRGGLAGLKTKEMLEAFFKSADEADLLGAIPRIAKTPFEITELKIDEWFNYFLHHYNVTMIPGMMGMQELKSLRTIEAVDKFSVLEKYPAFCLRLPRILLDEIFPNQEHLGLQVNLIRNAKANLARKFNELGTAPREPIPNEVRKIVLAYEGFGVEAIAEVEANARPPAAA